MPLKSFSVGAHRRCFSVHEALGGDDLSSKCGGDGLVPETHPEDGCFSGEGLDEGDGNPGGLRPAGAGGNDDARRIECPDFVDAISSFRNTFTSAPSICRY